MTELEKRVEKARQAIESKPEQGTNDYLLNEVLRDVAEHLKKENRFVDAGKRKPEFTEDWDYASVKVIGVIRVEGNCRTRPLAYQRTVIRNKRVERWVNDDGTQIQNGEVVYWMYYPTLDEDNKEGD